MADPLVSITVITYQHGAFIKDCLDSLLNQDLAHPYEILIGEDGSTDGTRESGEYASMYPDKIRLFLNEGQNKIRIEDCATGRRNMLDLLKACKGKYIANCEGDDYWLSRNKLRKQVELLESHEEAAGSYHDTLVVDEKGQVLRPFRVDLPESMTLNSMVGELAPFHYSSFIFRRSLDPTSKKVYEEVGPFDFLLFAEIAANGKLLKVEDVQSAYRKHVGGVTETLLHKDMTFQMHRMLLWTCIMRLKGVDTSLVRGEIVNRYQEICARALGKRMTFQWLGKYYLRALRMRARPDLATVMSLLRAALRSR